MEILALLGMPKVQSTPNRNNSFATFTVGADTGADTTGTMLPGAPFDVLKAVNSAGWSDVTTRLSFLAGVTTLGPVVYDRMAFGWRIVNTKGIVGDNQQCPHFDLLAAPGTSTSYTRAPTPVSQIPQLTVPEGQYFELVVDFRTSDAELYLDGMFLTRWRIFSTPQVVNRNMGLLIDMTIDNYRPNISAIEYRGYVRDIYMAGLGINEVFEPTGGLDITNLDTASITYQGSITPANIDNWTFSWSQALDSAATAEHRQVMADPTPLKTAVAITAMCPGISPAGLANAYMEARSGGVKIADETKWTAKSGNQRVVRIDPATIGNDLTIAFKVDP